MIGIFLMAFSFALDNMVLIDFKDKTESPQWMVIDDVVMGGKSFGQFMISQERHGIFYGDVSLENNGGFSMVRCGFDAKVVSSYSTIAIYLKGDGKRYQFRIKSQNADPHSYIYHFQTSGDWQTVEIPMKDMKPTFRGRALDMPNYDGSSIEEIAFLIGNKKAETFRLEVEKIILK